jgi:hypothetical protein
LTSTPSTSSTITAATAGSWGWLSLCHHPLLPSTVICLPCHVQLLLCLLLQQLLQLLGLKGATRSLILLLLLLLLLFFNKTTSMFKLLLLLFFTGTTRIFKLLLLLLLFFNETTWIRMLLLLFIGTTSIFNLLLVLLFLNETTWIRTLLLLLLWFILLALLGFLLLSIPTHCTILHQLGLSCKMHEGGTTQGNYGYPILNNQDTHKTAKSAMGGQGILVGRATAIVLLRTSHNYSMANLFLVFG